MVYENRTGQNLNRKKLTIVSKSDTEMIVDVERGDSVTKEGTKVNASTFQALEDKIATALTNANMAYVISSNALEEASKVCKTKFTLEGTQLIISDI